jgi:hypothetical protein
MPACDTTAYNPVLLNAFIQKTRPTHSMDNGTSC